MILVLYESPMRVKFHLSDTNQVWTYLSGGKEGILSDKTMIWPQFKTSNWSGGIFSHGSLLGVWSCFVDRSIAGPVGFVVDFALRNMYIGLLV